MRNFTILLDLDEVLADFVGSALQVHGVTFASLAPKWTPGQWDMTLPMGLTMDQFWTPIYTMGERFWSGLSPTPWANELIALVEQYDRDWHIVTSPNRCVTSYAGKARWIKERFGSHFDRFAITPHKSLFARPDAILIDDRDETIHDFTNAGGLGIVFPAYHNSQHRQRADPIYYVKRMLTLYTKG